MVVTSQKVVATIEFFVDAGFIPACELPGFARLFKAGINPASTLCLIVAISVQTASGDKPRIYIEFLSAWIFQITIFMIRTSGTGY